MRKLVLLLLMSLMIMGLGVGAAMAALPPGLTSGGQSIECDPQPFFAQDRIMAPVGAVCDLLGINPVFSEANSTINLTLNGNTLTVYPGQNKAQLNGKDTVLPLAVQTVDNFTFVPLRAVVEALGAQVTWNDAQQTADVIAPGDSNQIMVFHAGSLAAPLRDISIAFKTKNPKINIFRESAGSIDCVRKVTEQGQKADLLVLADYSLFDQLMVPQYASWYAMFAKNEMVLCYREGAPGSDQINDTNWYQTLLTAGTKFGHTDPNLDPAGYRSLMVWQLAEKYYKSADLNAKLTAACPAEQVYKTADGLVADLKAGKIDYAFEYLSVAKQNGFKYVTLPKEINLADPGQADFYKQAQVETVGTDGTKTIQVGLPIVCGLAIPNNAPNPELAAEFAAQIMNADGQKIIEAAGQIPIAPPQFNDASKVPQILKDIK